MTTNEHKLARTLIEAHTAPEVAPVVLEAFDQWVVVVEGARDAIEQQQRSADDLRRYYTVKELMLLLRKSDSAVRSMLKDGTLPYTTIGGSIRVPIAPVEQYLADRTEQHTPAPRPPRQRFSPADADVVSQHPWLVD
jgi:excisionase family DNA binding protein